MSDAADFSSRLSLPHVDPQFIRRWSPRALSPQPLPAEHLAAIFEAARWAPSCFNEQPWLFYTSTPQTFAAYLALLTPTNRSWAQHAAVLGFVVSRQYFRRNNKPNAHADFDAGSAWMAVALQASLLGYHAHGMAGVDFEAAYEYLQLQRGQYRVIAGFALGARGDPAQLSVEQQANEKPNGRVPLADIWPTQPGAATPFSDRLV